MIRVGVPKENFPHERRVALVPRALSTLKKAGLECIMERDAGIEAGFPDTSYVEKGAVIADSRSEVFASADIIAQVRTYGANREAGRDDLRYLRAGQIVVGFSESLSEPAAAEAVAATRAILFDLELVPRITRAQSMDALSSMATIAGYKAALFAADHLSKMFPMMVTAAGTITPAKVFVIGAGVAGLQAIATAKRLGAVVHAYDIRPAVKEQVESLGARFIELALETGDAEGSGGYAKAMGEDFYRKQGELIAGAAADNDAVITTAAVPGKRSPILITKSAVEAMRPGSVIVDLAAERGGNCELTRPGEIVRKNGVTILGPLNLPSTVPYHASQMYAKNVTSFLQILMKDGSIHLNPEDEIIRETLVTRDGEVVHTRVREALGSARTSA